MTNLTNVSKFENKLRRIIQLNEKGAVVYTNKTSEALAFCLSKSELIEAFKVDIDETAKDLINALPIINSVKNGIVHELKTLDNSVESFFGKTYNKDTNSVFLSGIKFDLNKNTNISKTEVIDTIYLEVFEITRKELNTLLKSLIKFDETTDEIEKTLLFPSTILADNIISKVGLIDSKFNEFRQTMSYEEKAEFSATFNRSGIQDVIQNSTYVDKTGVRQTIPSHNKQSSYVREIANGIKNNEFKYIEAVEIDGDADCEKALRVINQIERLKINCEYKFTLKFRKLGNYKARGLFMKSGLIVAEDCRDTSALLHEIAHFIHLSNNDVYTSDFVNYMINKMTKRIELDNIQGDDWEKNEILKKSDYYCDPKEVIARTLEIAALYATESSKLIMSTNDFDLIKSRDFYTRLEGIYFNFTTFDENTIEELSKLFEMFYETSYDVVHNTNINNFYKIDTEYNRVELEKVLSISDILRQEAKRAEKDKRTLYGMVNSDNIKLIIDNRPASLSLDKLCTLIFGNLHFCSGHAKSLTAEGWAEVKESKSMMVLMMLDMIKATKTEVQYLEYLHELDKNKVLDIMDGACLVSGFSIKWRMEIKKKLNEKYPEGAFKSFNTFYSSIARNVFNIASDEIINNYEYMKQYISENKYFLDQVKYSMSEENIIRHSFDILNEHEMSALSFPKVVFSNSKFVITYFAKNPTNVDDIRYCSEEILSNTTVMYNVLTSIAGAVNSENFYIAFNSISTELHEDVDFVKHFMQFHNCIVDGVSEDVRNIILGKQEEIIVEVKKTKSTKIKKAKVENIEIDEVKNERFEKILQSVQIIEKPHSQTGEILKTFKVEEDLGEDFQSFAKYLKSNDIGYYSRFLRAFVVNNIERIAAASVVVTSYNQDLLELFAQGRLF